MGKKSRKKRITSRWLLLQLMFHVLPWVFLIWAAMAFITANNSTVPKAVPMRVDVAALEQKLKNEEKPGHDIVRIQNLRFDLILEYINKDQVVKAREQLVTYKNWLNTNADLSLADRIEMHEKLSIIHTSFGEFDAAVNEYTLILKELERLDNPQSRILRARFLNNRGVSNFFNSQGSEKDEMRKQYLSSSIEDFRASQDITESNAAVKGESAEKLGYLNQIVKENEHCVDLERMFTPLPLQP